MLTEIDVRATVRTKLGEQMEDYLILGACNPPLAHRALQVDRRIGLLPCNVTVRCDGEETVVPAQRTSFRWVLGPSALGVPGMGVDPYGLAGGAWGGTPAGGCAVPAC